MTALDMLEDIKMTTALNHELCSHCRQPVGQYDRSCRNCGKRLDGAAQLATPLATPVATQGRPSALLRVLVGLAILGGAVGFLLASQATAGVAMIACALLLAVLARIEQASTHHAVIVALLKQR
jgi:hypothetical protein